MVISGLIILAGLNVVLGVLVFVVSYRLFALRAHLSERISKVEERISRLEVLMGLSMTRPEKVPQEGIIVAEDSAHASRSLVAPANPRSRAGASGSGKQV